MILYRITAFSKQVGQPGGINQASRHPIASSYNRLIEEDRTLQDEHDHLNEHPVERAFISNLEIAVQSMGSLETAMCSRCLLVRVACTRDGGYVEHLGRSIRLDLGRLIDWMFFQKRCNWTYRV